MRLRPLLGVTFVKPLDFVSHAVESKKLNYDLF